MSEVNEGLTIGQINEALMRGERVTHGPWGGYWFNVWIGGNAVTMAHIKDGRIDAATPYPGDWKAQDWRVLPADEETEAERNSMPYAVLRNMYPFLGGGPAAKELLYQVFPSDARTIAVEHDEQYGGAHTYHIQNSLGFNPATQQAETGLFWQTLTFVHKPDGDKPMVEGLQSEQLAYVLLDRTIKLNNRFPSKHNKKMITGLTMFLEACQERVQERMDAGVMGKLQAIPETPKDGNLPLTHGQD